VLAKGLKQKIREIALAPYADGRFEVIVDGKKIHSKLETGEFPDEQTILAKVKKLV